MTVTVKTLGVGLVCALFWLLLSGYLHSTVLLGLGALSTVLVVVVTRRLGIIDNDLPNLVMVLRILGYLPWLIKEIALANVDVIRRILARDLPISPCMVDVKTNQRTDIARVVYANSITLTPGTVSVRVHDDVIEVHALTREAADHLQAGEMDYRTRRLEGL